MNPPTNGCPLNNPGRLSDEETVRQKADTFFSKAKHLLKMNIDVPCLDNIHASILVGNLCGAEAQSATEGIFFGELAIIRPDQRLTST